MEYRAVSKRCAVHLPTLNLPVSDEHAMDILIGKGFKVLEVDMIEMARQCISTSTYRRGAKLSEAPHVFDCSSFVKWLYGQRGIWLPRRSIQQRGIGMPIPIESAVRGDVIFTTGYINYYLTDPCDGVGHVGIMTGEGTVIHSANAKTHVVESSVEDFVGKDEFRGIRRYMPGDQAMITLEVPYNRDVEVMDDLKWIVLQSLPK